MVHAWAKRSDHVVARAGGWFEIFGTEGGRMRAQVMAAYCERMMEDQSHVDADGLLARSQAVAEPPPRLLVGRQPVRIRRRRDLRRSSRQATLDDRAKTLTTDTIIMPDGASFASAAAITDANSTRLPRWRADPERIRRESRPTSRPSSPPLAIARARSAPMGERARAAAGIGHQESQASRPLLRSRRRESRDGIRRARWR